MGLALAVVRQHDSPGLHFENPVISSPKRPAMSYDPIAFPQEDEEEPASISPSEYWRVLIVDDEEDVHSATRLALCREQICGRPLEFTHAYSAEEAFQFLKRNKDIAVVLLDVVMEHDNSGLDLVRKIREELRRDDIRIILRTGQPGYAPELDSVKRYDINDYKSKADLTRTQLYTALTTAIRSYAQILQLQQGNALLKQLAFASRQLLLVRDFTELGQQILTQVCQLLRLETASGIVCIDDPNEANLVNRTMIVTVNMKSVCNTPKPLKDYPDQCVAQRISQAHQARRHLFGSDYTCLYFGSRKGRAIAVYCPEKTEMAPLCRHYVNFLENNIVAAYENVRLLEQRRRFSYIDTLLQIPNRMAFLQQINHHLKQGKADQIVVLIDIDQFGAINDTIGAQYGDILLVEIAKRLCHDFAKSVVARVSGDTFGILGAQTDLDPERVSQSFQQPFYADSLPHSLSATQGRVELKDQQAATEVLSQAGVALKRAKQTLRGGFENFHSAMLKETESRVRLLQNLRHAFDQDRLFMVFQPKICLRDGSVTGFEALMRWKTEEGLFIPPVEFIPIAESSGLIIPVGEWALQNALMTIGELRQKTGLDISVAVNVSVVQLNHPDFLSMLQRTVAFSNAHYDWLELEITESFAMDDLKKGQQLLAEINALGVNISIDDFGTGFSSLNYLEQLDVTSLKIDKSFVDRITADDPDTRIPETILRLGQILELEVVAEGVETEEQAQWLTNAGCHYGQGYFYARPMAKNDLVHWTTEWIRTNKHHGHAS